MQKRISKLNREIACGNEPLLMKFISGEMKGEITKGQSDGQPDLPTGGFQYSQSSKTRDQCYKNTFIGFKGGRCFPPPSPPQSCLKWPADVE